LGCDVRMRFQITSKASPRILVLLANMRLECFYVHFFVGAVEFGVSFSLKLFHFYFFDHKPALPK
jgi:hypothetical protein